MPFLFIFAFISSFVLCHFHLFLRDFDLLARLIQCNQLLLPIRGSRRYDTLYRFLFPFPPRRKRGRKMRIHRLRRRTTKCLPRKWTWKGLNALSRYRLPRRRRSLPTLRRDPVFPLLFSFPPQSQSFLLTVAAPVLTGCILPRFQTNGTLHCLPTLQQATPSSLPGRR